MTRIAIACPGPSLLYTYDHLSDDLTLAINGAAALVPHDWWCVGDAVVLKWYPHAVPLQGVYTQDTWWSRYRPDLRVEHLHWDTLRCAPPHHGQPWDTTLPAAIALAAHLGATHVDLYGCDWQGGDYAPGVLAYDGPADLRPNRWQTEQIQAYRVAEACRLTLTRHLPKAAP